MPFTFNEPAPAAYAADGRMSPAYIDWVKRRKAAETAYNAEQVRTQQETAAQLPGADQMNERRDNLFNETQNRQESPFRAQQDDLVRALQGQANGTAPSLAEMMVNRQRDAAVAQQRSMAASARPDLAGLAQLQAGQNVGAIGADAAQQASMGRLAEQQQAQALLGQVLGGARGQDLQSGAQRDAMLQALLGQQLQQAGMQQSGNLSLEQMLLQQRLAQMQIDAARVPWWQRALSAGMGILQIPGVL